MTIINNKEQLEFCEILDNWYLECKSGFSAVHPLGMRKEDLKQQVCKWIENKKFEKEKEIKQTTKEFNLSEQIFNKNIIINEATIQESIAKYGGIEFSYTGELIPLEEVECILKEFIEKLKEKTKLHPYFIDIIDKLSGEKFI